MKICLLMPLFLFLLTACSGGGDSNGGNATLPPPVVVVGPQKPNTNDFDQDISSASCPDPISFVEDWREELRTQINFGSAACVKKVIELGKIDVNKPLVQFGSNAQIIPLIYALEASSLFFSKNNGGDFTVVKVLLEAGANPNLTGVMNSNVLHFALNQQHILKDYPVVISYLIHSGKVPLEAFNNEGLSPYHMAIELGLASDLLLFFDKKIDINKKTQDGRTPLDLALNSSRQLAADTLISNNVSVDISDSQGQNALLKAISLNFESTSLLLLAPKAEININHQNNSQQTALYLSIQQRMTSVALALLDRAPDVDLRTAASTPLHLALQTKQTDIANRIIEKVKNKSAKNNNGQSIAHMVAIYGNKSQLQQLINHSFPLDLNDNQGTTPLFSTVINDNIELAEHLLSAGVSPDAKITSAPAPLHYARSLKMVILLAEAGADVNAINPAGVSPLHIFTIQDQSDVVDYLLKHKADYKWTSQNGKNLLMTSLEQNNLSLASLYVEAGLSPHEKNHHGETAVFFVQSEAAVQFLVSYGVDLDVLNNDQASVLSQKMNDYLNHASDNNKNTVLGLITAGADVNYKYPDTKNSYLHRILGFSIEVVLGNPSQLEFNEVLKALLMAGADVNAKNKEKQTPLFLADTVGEVQLLMDYNADPQLKDSNGDIVSDVFEIKRIFWNSELQILEEAKNEAQIEFDLAYGADPKSQAAKTAQQKLTSLTEKWARLKMKIENLSKMISLL